MSLTGFNFKKLHILNKCRKFAVQSESNKYTV